MKSPAWSFDLVIGVCSRLNIEAYVALSNINYVQRTVQWVFSSDFSWNITRNSDREAIGSLGAWNLERNLRAPETTLPPAKSERRNHPCCGLQTPDPRTHILSKYYRQLILPLQCFDDHFKFLIQSNEIRSQAFT
jgi:hypothetical protein